MTVELALSSRDPLLGASLVCALASSAGAVSILAAANAEGSDGEEGGGMAAAGSDSKIAARTLAVAQVDEAEASLNDLAPQNLGPQPDASVVIGGVDGAADGAVETSASEATADGGSSVSGDC